MKIFFITVVIGVGLWLAFLITPDGIRDRFLAAINFPDLSLAPVKNLLSGPANTITNTVRDTKDSIIDKIVPKSPQERRAELISELAATLEELQDFQEAMKFYFEAMRLVPKNPVYLLAAGRMAGRARAKQRQAVELYERALDIDSKLREGYLELGNLLSRSGLLTRARRVYQTGLKHLPMDLDLKARLAEVDAAHRSR